MRGSCVATATQEHGWRCIFIGGVTGRIDGVGKGAGGRRTFRVVALQGLKVSLAVVWPLLNERVELVSWRECALHVPVSFDLIVGSQEALRYPTFQKIQGSTDGPLWGYPLCKGRGKIQKLDWGCFEGQ